MPGPNLTSLIARLKELGIESPPMPKLAQTFEKCEACKGWGRTVQYNRQTRDGYDDEEIEVHCEICMGAGQLPDNKLAEWIKTMSENMDKAYGKS